MENRRLKSFFKLTAGVLAICLATGCTHVSNPRADFLKTINRPPVPLAAEVDALPATSGIVQYHFSFATDASQRVPGILMKLADSQGRRPVVIALHGTGGSKQNMLALCRKLAANGFIAVAIDGRYHGERTKSGKGSAEYEAAIIRAWQGNGEHPFYYDTVWDVMRLMDYLDTRDDVDPSRIGLIGISKGGIESYLAAAVDERIAVVVPCIGVQSFQWALANNDWQGRISTIQPAFDTIVKESGVIKPDVAFVGKFYDQVVPGIYSEFDGPEMLPLIAPRPLLIINSDGDIHTPLPGVMECVAVAQKVYHADGADDHLSVIIQQNAGHEVRPASERAAIDWFVKWLKP